MKIILENKPNPLSNGQYNFDDGRIGGMPFDTNISGDSVELFSLVESSIPRINPTHPLYRPSGLMWNYLDSRIEFLNVSTKCTATETLK